MPSEDSKDETVGEAANSNPSPEPAASLLPAKKKERTIVVPTCPSTVSTAYLIVRGAILAVAGAANVGGTAVTCSLLQATYLKDPDTGKFSMALGKKLGDKCQLDLPEDDPSELYEAIEQTANRIVAEQHSIRCFQATKQQILDTYGEGVLDGSHTKTKPDQILTVAYIPGLIVAVTPSVPLVSTGSLSQITIDRDQCQLSCGKKARKADITVKFRAMIASSSSSSTVTPLAEITSDGIQVNIDDMDTLGQAKVRCPEGIALLEKQEMKQQETTEKTFSGNEEAIASTATTSPTAESDEMVVNIENVTGLIDYDKLVDQFGSNLIDDALLAQLEAATVGAGRVPRLHRFLRRGMFFSHRDLHTLLDAVQSGTPMYLYTGRGPSSESMHLGHLIPFLFTKWLQDAFDAPLVIQMTDDEKFLFKGVYEDETGDNLDHFARLTIENAKDIIACEFDYDKTFLFSDLDYVGTMYPNIVRIWKAVTTNAVSNIFGFDGSANVGKIAFPAVQAAPSFPSSFPKVLGQANNNSNPDQQFLCLIPCAIDQDPYFRMTRDIAHKLVKKGHKLGGKPALIHSKFFPPLQGTKGKMSSSDENSAIFLTDSPEDIKRKITHHAFSGGRETKAKQEELGADLEVDVAYQWLRFFLEDDEELARIGQSYGSGKGEYWNTVSVKNKLIEVLQKLVGEHQERRAKITDDDVRKWMMERSIIKA
jgi:tryptophanyl-tRNA synthetase